MSESGHYSDDYSDNSDYNDNDYNDYDYNLGEYYDDDEELFNQYEDESENDNDDDETDNYSDDDQPEIVYGSNHPVFNSSRKTTDTYSRYYNRVWDIIVIFLILGIALFVGFKSI